MPTLRIIVRRTLRRLTPRRSDFVPATSGIMLGVAAFLVLIDRADSSTVDNRNANVAFEEQADIPTAEMSVSARAIDGDTIEVLSTGERVRLANIDTPETEHRAQCQAEREAGERAKREARALVDGGSVTIERTGRKDNYGRTIGYVKIDNRDMGEMMMARELARPWRGRREPWCAADGALLPAD